MPDLEALMSELEPAFEEALRAHKLPPPDLDMSVEEYARVACAILDIPVHPRGAGEGGGAGAGGTPGPLIQALHVLVTL
jgi:hypothetical protein